MAVEATTWRNRIVDSADVAPSQLVGNPRNWRLHPRHQGDALAAALDEVGWVQSVIVNRRSGHLIDGHLRVALALQRNEPTVPVDYVDLDDEEERLVLATLDPLAGLAGADEAALRGLAATLDGLDAVLAKVLADLTSAPAAAATLPTQDQIDARRRELERGLGQPIASLLDVSCPACGHEFAINPAEVEAWKGAA